MIERKKFSHIRTQYGLLDVLNKINNLINRIVILDVASKVYIAKNNYRNKRAEDKFNYHLILLVENNKDYPKLISHIENYYFL